MTLSTSVNAKSFIYLKYFDSQKITLNIRQSGTYTYVVNKLFSGKLSCETQFI